MKLAEYKEKKMKDPEFKKAYEKMKNDLISRQDAHPNVKGEWVEADLDRDLVTCSICKNAGYKDRMAWRPDYAKKYFNFCPNCGARMKPTEDAEV